jgi:hypothetical protein
MYRLHRQVHKLLSACRLSLIFRINTRRQASRKRSVSAEVKECQIAKSRFHADSFWKRALPEVVSRDFRALAMSKQNPVSFWSIHAA